MQAKSYTDKEVCDGLLRIFPAKPFSLFRCCRFNIMSEKFLIVLTEAPMTHTRQIPPGSLKDNKQEGGACGAGRMWVCCVGADSGRETMPLVQGRTCWQTLSVGG